uniref:Secreted protein n=1 Tax=Colletotrichum fructicola (strain Nara gc5) TaxID=1213859 RepID=L2GCD3_COLFN
MLSNLINLVPMALFGGAMAAPSPIDPAVRVCYATETPSQLCYTAPDNIPQDVQFIASYLRSYGAQIRTGRLFNMAADAPDCGEWLVYAHGTAQAFAKHINNTVNSSVLFADIATTIDGGVGASEAQIATSLLGCGTDGGSLGVLVNTANPTYSGSTYPAGYVTDGIIIKIVASGA